MWSKVLKLCLPMVVLSSTAALFFSDSVITLTEDTWSHMLEGEWLVEFYVPWCPACQAFASTWSKVATWQKKLEIKVAKIDVTTSTSFIGRFLIFSLPTIYHVKDGRFRRYKGPPDVNNIVHYVMEEKWKEQYPTPFLYNPTYPHMVIIGWIVKASMMMKDIHNSLTVVYGVPSWASYMILACATAAVGHALQLLIAFSWNCVSPFFAPWVTALTDRLKRTSVYSWISGWTSKAKRKLSTYLSDDVMDEVNANPLGIPAPRQSRGSDGLDGLIPGGFSSDDDLDGTVPSSAVTSDDDSVLPSAFSSDDQESSVVQRSSRV